MSHCYKCGLTTHNDQDCHDSSPCNQPTQQRQGRAGTGGNSTENQNQQIACAVQVLRRTEEKEAEGGMDTLELKTRKKMKVLNWACMEAEIKDNFLMISGKVWNKKRESFAR